ncbi:hypothetical protein cyc_03055 [Cyclospora cayetanensis]|uniref:Uncharacterized protein n=1 Tax=Cyclospora cayetanensis TaxID=88456 RepID=A0A1D3CTM0_9EIME|nr:hypothetical protein cyc_03055 [Cyclospora cayetanensis]
MLLAPRDPMDAEFALRSLHFDGNGGNDTANGAEPTSRSQAAGLTSNLEDAAASSDASSLPQQTAAAPAVFAAEVGDLSREAARKAEEGEPPSGGSTTTTTTTARPYSAFPEEASADDVERAAKKSEPEGGELGSRHPSVEAPQTTFTYTPTEAGEPNLAMPERTLTKDDMWTALPKNIPYEDSTYEAELEGRGGLSDAMHEQDYEGAESSDSVAQEAGDEEALWGLNKRPNTVSKRKSATTMAALGTVAVADFLWRHFFDTIFLNWWWRQLINPDRFKARAVSEHSNAKIHVTIVSDNQKTNRKGKSRKELEALLKSKKSIKIVPITQATKDQVQKAQRMMNSAFEDMDQGIEKPSFQSFIALDGDGNLLGGLVAHSHISEKVQHAKLYVPGEDTAVIQYGLVEALRTAAKDKGITELHILVQTSCGKESTQGAAEAGSAKKVLSLLSLVPVRTERYEYARLTDLKTGGTSGKRHTVAHEAGAADGKAGDSKEAQTAAEEGKDTKKGLRSKIVPVTEVGYKE